MSISRSLWLLCMLCIAGGPGVHGGNTWSWGHNVRGELGLGDGLLGGDPRYPNQVPGCTTDNEKQDEMKCNQTRSFMLQPELVGGAVGFDKDLMFVDAGAYHTIGVTKAGSLLSWGWNGYGQLGTDSNVPTYGLPQSPSDWSQRNLPSAVRYVDGIKFVSASAGMYHSAALSESAEVYTWGVNFEGQLCLGSLKNQNFPRKIARPTNVGGWLQVSLGQEHTVLLAGSRDVFACGSNRVNQLGMPATGDYEHRALVPTQVPTVNDIVKISSGQFHTMNLRADGRVWVFGDNRFAQHALGVNQQAKAVDGATEVQFFNNPELADELFRPDPAIEAYRVVDIAAGSYHCLAMVAPIPSYSQFRNGTELYLISPHFRTKGQPLPHNYDAWGRSVYSWGYNNYNQLGKLQTNSQERLARPFKMEMFENLNLVAIFSGNYHSAVLGWPDIKEGVCKNGEWYNPVDPAAYCDGFHLYMWGGNVNGELGTGNRKFRVGPQINPRMLGRNVTHVSLGFRHSVAITGACPSTSRDACGVCYGTNHTCIGCDMVANSGQVIDACGLCGGNNQTCWGCDQVPNSGLVIDVCGVCGGDTTTCQDCSGTPNGGKVIDTCGVCGGDSSSCQGCDGVPASGIVFDECESCGGDNSQCSMVLFLISAAHASPPALLCSVVAALLAVVATMTVG